MQKFITSILWVASSVLCANAYALVPQVYEYRADYGGGGNANVWQSSEQAACTAAGAAAQSVSQAGSDKYTYEATGINGASTPSYQRACVYTVTRPNGSVLTTNLQFTLLRRGPSCPANSTASADACKCDVGFDEVGGQCKPRVDQCAGQTGKTGILNWTEGYTRTPDEGDRKAVGSVYSPPSSGSVCLGSCAVSLQTSGPGVQPLVSQAPTSQGLYRRSVDYPYVALGTSCNPGVADVGADKNATPPDCPGTVGEYSGHPVCVGTAAKPVIASGMPQAPGSTPIAGNPTAGDKPATGEGSGSGSAGRTPSGGDGTAKGGPADAGKGGKGGEAGGTADGTGVSPKRTDDKEPDACGAPGQPECSVRVNEKGTPEGAGTTFDASKDKIEQTGNDTIQKINAARDRTDSPSWTFTFSLPTGCAPYTIDIASIKLDVCRWQGTIHDLLSMVWAAVTAFTIIGMVGRTIRGT